MGGGGGREGQSERQMREVTLHRNGWRIPITLLDSFDFIFALATGQRHRAKKFERGHVFLSNYREASILISSQTMILHITHILKNGL